MTTATLASPRTRAPTEPVDDLSDIRCDRAPPEEYIEMRLVALDGYIRDAVRHCGERDHGMLDFEDMLQEATLAVWKVLKKEPDAKVGFIWTVAYRAAIHSLRQGKSVDRPVTRGPVQYQVVTLDRMMEDPEGLDIVEMALARYRRRGEVPRPTEDTAVALVMLQELWDVLTPKQQQVLALRLKQNSEQETGDVLGMGQANVHKVCMRIKEKARVAWGDQPPPPKRKTRDEKTLTMERRARMKAYKISHRDQVNARRRALYHEQRKQGMDWHARHRDADNARRRARKREMRGLVK